MNGNINSASFEINELHPLAPIKAVCEPQAYGLTKREIEVLELMSQGLSQKQIAKKMYLSPFTVNSHVQKIYLKLRVNSGIAAIVKAIRENIIP